MSKRPDVYIEVICYKEESPAAHVSSSIFLIRAAVFGQTVPVFHWFTANLIRLYIYIMATSQSSYFNQWSIASEWKDRSFK